MLARAKCNIAAIDILEQPSSELHDLELKHGVKVGYYRCDIRSKSKVEETVSKIEADFQSPIDVLVCAAGVVKDESFLETTEANLAQTFNVNVNGSFFVAQACAASMIRRVESSHGAGPIEPTKTGGSIIFIASISVHTPSAAQNISAYVASKAAVLGLVKPLAIELAPYGIRVNSLSPGYTMTDMMAGLQKEQPDLVRQFEKETLLGSGSRIGRPEDLHGPLLMLSSRKAGGWVTGQDVLVDGGAAGWKHPAVL